MLLVIDINAKKGKFEAKYCNPALAAVETEST